MFGLHILTLKPNGEGFDSRHTDKFLVQNKWQLILDRLQDISRINSDTKIWNLKLEVFVLYFKIYRNKNINLHSENYLLCLTPVSHINSVDS